MQSSKESKLQPINELVLNCGIKYSMPPEPEEGPHQYNVEVQCKLSDDLRLWIRRFSNLHRPKSSEAKVSLFRPLRDKLDEQGCRAYIRIALISKDLANYLFSHHFQHQIRSFVYSHFMGEPLTVTDVCVSGRNNRLVTLNLKQNNDAIVKFQKALADFLRKLNVNLLGHQVVQFQAQLVLGEARRTEVIALGDMAYENDTLYDASKVVSDMRKKLPENPLEIFPEIFTIDSDVKSSDSLTREIEHVLCEGFFIFRSLVEWNKWLQEKGLPGFSFQLLKFISEYFVMSKDFEISMVKIPSLLTPIPSENKYDFIHRPCYELKYGSLTFYLQDEYVKDEKQQTTRKVRLHFERQQGSCREMTSILFGSAIGASSLAKITISEILRNLIAEGYDEASKMLDAVDEQNVDKEPSWKLRKTKYQVNYACLYQPAPAADDQCTALAELRLGKN